MSESSLPYYGSVHKRYAYHEHREAESKGDEVSCSVIDDDSKKSQCLK